MVDFPEIKILDDVLPYVEDFKSISTIDKDSYIVIDYVVLTPGLFDISDDPVGGMIRRECRGLIFDKRSGTIMSRPFHKFFNVNEREETLAENIDLNKNHVIMEKMDGSMVRPMLRENSTLTLATRKGITDIGVAAATLLSEYQSKWLFSMMCMGYTPIMEYISPLNKIVVSYDESRLVLLAIRNNITGEYLDIADIRTPFDVVPMYGSLSGDLSEYISMARGRTEREGDILAFESGDYYKIKNDWYVNLHKAKEEILFDRNIVKHFLDSTIDDILPNLPKVDVDRCHDVYAEFLLRKKVFTGKVLELANRVVESGMSKKDFAVDMSKSIDKIVVGMVFKVMDKEDDPKQVVIDLVNSYIQSSLATNTKYDLMMEKLEEFEWRKE